MWRDEAGIVEMLFAYIGEFEEFKDFSSWRRVVIDILTCHENFRLHTIPAESVKDEKTTICGNEAQEEEVVKQTEDAVVGETENNNGKSPEEAISSELRKTNTDASSLQPNVIQPGFVNYITAWPVVLVHDLTGESDDDEAQKRKDDNLKLDANKAQNVNEQGVLMRVARELGAGFPESVPQAVEDMKNCSSTESIGEANELLSKLPLNMSRFKSCDPKREHICPVCSKTFSAKGHLRGHMRVHTGERPYKCNYCWKSFAQSGTLKTHLRTHSGERPYSCSECYRTFSDNSSLHRHKRIHTGARPYVCKTCGRKFSQSNSLKVHRKTHEDDMNATSLPSFELTALKTEHENIEAD